MVLSLEKENLFGISGSANISRGPEISIIPLLRSFHRFGIALIQLFSSNKYNQ